MKIGIVTSFNKRLYEYYAHRFLKSYNWPFDLLIYHEGWIPEDFAVRGRDLVTGIPKEIVVSYTEIAYALDNTISKIEEAILSALEMTPPELSADIYRTGIYLAGGGSMLRGLDKRISSKTKLPVWIAEDTLRAVARGTSIALKNINQYQFLIRD